MQFSFYARCGCCVLFQNSSVLVSSVQKKKNVTKSTLECQCCLFAKFSHAVMFSGSSFLSCCPAIITLLVQCFTDCGLITTNGSHFQSSFSKSTNLLLTLRLCSWGAFDRADTSWCSSHSLKVSPFVACLRTCRLVTSQVFEITFPAL